jgi:perosamine synthetase
MSDFDYIKDIVFSSQIARGALCNKLEAEFCAYLGVNYSMAVSSGTAALHLALLAMGIGQGDEVIIPSYTCTALLNAINYTGANPVLADIDHYTFNMNRNTIMQKLSFRTKAIILTHTFGFPAPIDDIASLGIPIIEDCAHALGSWYKSKPCGARGLVSIYSMYATKMICSGEGGIAATDDDKIALRISDLNNPDMREEYKIRYNYKLSDLAAGLALSQIGKINDIVDRRLIIADQYKEAFKSIPSVSFQRQIPDSKPNYYRFIISVPYADELIKYLQQENIMADKPVFKPLHHYVDTGNSDYPSCTEIWKNAVSIPIYPAMTDEEVQNVIKGVLKGVNFIER